MRFPLLLVFAGCALAAAAPAQTPSPAPASPAPRRPPVVSPEVAPDRTVTFRLYAPEARGVKVWGEWDGEETALGKDERGVWSGTVGPLASDLYGYSFKVDGLTLLDPENPVAKPSRATTQSALRVPGNGDVPLDLVPAGSRGTVHLHDYDSRSLGRTRRLRVYTPATLATTTPEGKTPARLPVLYLLHGAGDNESTWTEFGRAHVILDHLIAAGKAVPMIVVMPDGHATAGYSPESRAQNVAAFQRDFLEDLMPWVEARYPVANERELRAVAGLSMGGNQALLIGLNHRDRFAWVGGMSSAIREPVKPLESFWNDPVSSRTPLRLLWLAIGRDDFLLRENRAFDTLLTDKQVPHEYTETPGGHRWTVWRRYLHTLAPCLFQRQPTQLSSSPAQDGKADVQTPGAR